MRRLSGFVASVLLPFAAACALLLSGCGYAGEPKPPASLRPLKVSELQAVERGSKIEIAFYLPWETTEGLPVTGTPDTELRVGVLPVPWNQDTWRAASERIPVPEVSVARGASGSGGARPGSGAKAARPASGATGPSGGRLRSLFGRGTPAPPRKTAAPDKDLLLRTVAIDAAKYSGKTIVIGVLVHGPKGRDDGWSIVQMAVLPPLPVPLALTAADAPGAVHLQWTADAPLFRIYRRQPADSAWVQIGESTQPAFDDTTFTYGKTWQYSVKSARKTGDNLMESDASAVFTFTPVDRFPPAVPSGLVAIAGTRSAELVWDRVPDSDLAGYRVYRNGVKIADGLVTPAYSDKEVTAGSRYSYQVSAVDQAGNESAKCAAVEIVME